MSLLSSIINNDEGLYEGNLRHYFKGIFYSRGANNPYHNIRHSCDVVLKCYEALKFYKDKGEPIPLRDARSLLCAAIAHDLNHSGRAGNDDLNIQLAIRSWTKLCLVEDQDLNVVWHIRATEFGPTGHVYAFDNDPLTLKILRDADLSQICSVAWIRMIIFGLSEEMNMLPIDMLRMQETFLSKVRFESEWGQRFAPLIQEKIEESRELIEILDS